MTEQPQTILAISGSLRARSSNTAVLRAAGKAVPGHIKFVPYEDIGELPHFNPDIDDDEQEAASVKNLRAQIASAQGVLFCTPEYANGVPGSLKNALDWIVSSGEFNAKPVAVISVSTFPTGGEKALESLLLTLGMLGAQVGEAGSLKIPVISKKLGEAGEVTDEATLQAIRQLMENLIQRMNA
ncbi:UNVERIFIED_CONTAM: chromate reductase [Brevibacillus sp. OAP136]